MRNATAQQLIVQNAAGSSESACWPLHAVAATCNVGMIGIAASRGEYALMWTAIAAACYALAVTIRGYQANASVRGAAEPRTVDAVLDVIGPLFLEACSLLDNAALRDTEPWQRAFAELKAKAKKAIPSNAGADLRRKENDGHEEKRG